MHLLLGMKEKNMIPSDSKVRKCNYSVWMLHSSCYNIDQRWTIWVEEKLNTISFWPRPTSESYVILYLLWRKLLTRVSSQLAFSLCNADESRMRIETKNKEHSWRHWWPIKCFWIDNSQFYVYKHLESVTRSRATDPRCARPARGHESRVIHNILLFSHKYMLNLSSGTKK
jgi:hypothetical protein